MKYYKLKMAVFSVVLWSDLHRRIVILIGE
jgi:hypothetical protein